MSYVGLEREFSYSVLPLAAADPDMADFFRLRMIDRYADSLAPERIELLQNYSQLAMRNALKEGYQITGKDAILAVVSCVKGILQERSIKTGFADGKA